MAGLEDTPVTEAPLAKIIVADGFNPRRLITSDAFAADALSGLVQSIREFGVLQPLLVRSQGDGYHLIAGERRYVAAQEAGLTEVPIRVLDVDDDQAYAIAVIENAQRKDLDLVTETLVGFDLLSKRLNMSVPEVVTYLHKVRNNTAPDDLNVEPLLRSLYGTGITTWASRRAKILQLTPEEQTAVRQGQIDATVCVELIRLPAGARREALLQQAITESLSAAQLRVLVHASQQSGGSSPELKARVGDLRKRLLKLSSLTGDEAQRAEELIAEIDSRIDQLLSR
ncbi:hypothetical protein DFI_18490 (plasmid) [Deinococcus ficus]|uniref:ParB-like N-terminal domain-containing protein n=2 Tax=Deinococcus ficus TaxID=317577 RepID=A0A221T2V4_9DEIO|nr:hypothetical protein DFI_18490 [Deinococcus ficus]